MTPQEARLFGGNPILKLWLLQQPITRAGMLLCKYGFVAFLKWNTGQPRKETLPLAL
jgi:hypothetical protein